MSRLLTHINRLKQLPESLQRLTGIVQQNVTRCRYLRLHSLLMALLAIFYIWRPFVFDFYHDDWAAMVSIFREPGEFWRQFIIGMKSGSRPVTTFVTYVLLFCFGANAALWHSFVALVMFGNAFLLWKLLRALSHESTSGFAAFLGAVFMTLSPAAMYFGSWASGWGATLGSFFCLASFLSLVRVLDKGRITIMPAFLFFLSIGCYESTFFAFGPFFLLYAFLRGWKNWRQALWLFASYLVVQFTVLWLTLRSLKISDPKNVLTDNITKNIMDRSAEILLQGIRQVWHAARHGGADFFIIAFVVVIILAAYGRLNKFSLRRVLLAYGAIISGLLLTGIILSLGGYQFSFAGAEARTGVIFIMWSALGIGVLISMLSSLLRRNNIQTLGIITLVFFLVSSGHKIYRIASLYSVQHDLIKLMRSAQLRPEKDTIFLVESALGEYEAFTAFWDISGALLVQRKDFRAVYEFRVDFAYAIRRGIFGSEYENGEFIQRMCGTNIQLWSKKAKRVMYIDLMQNKVRDFQDGEKIDCPY